MAKSPIQFKSINRLIAILRPKLAFLDWINSMPDDPHTMTMEDISRENFCFLIPEYESNEQGHEFILKNAEAILEVQLDGWDQSGETWPEKLDRRLLQKRVRPAGVRARVGQDLKNGIHVDHKRLPPIVWLVLWWKNYFINKWTGQRGSYGFEVELCFRCRYNIFLGRKRSEWRERRNCPGV